MSVYLKKYPVLDPEPLKKTENKCSNEKGKMFIVYDELVSLIICGLVKEVFFFKCDLELLKILSVRSGFGIHFIETTSNKTSNPSIMGLTLD